MSSHQRDNCALCMRREPLRNSHIIPEFLYKPLYEDNIHRYNTFGLEGTPDAGFEQMGEREKLLCARCEQRFSDYERYAAVFYRGAIKAFSNSERPELLFEKSLKFTRRGNDGMPTAEVVPALLSVQGINYEQLKLFLLSLIWRMGVSNLHFFREVDLGVHHESQIRTMLLNNDPGEPNIYPCKLRLITIQTRLLTDCQLQPRKERYEGKTFYRLFSTGVRFDFCISNQFIHPAEIECFCLKRQDEYVWVVEPIDNFPDLIAELRIFGKQSGIC